MVILNIPVSQVAVLIGINKYQTPGDTLLELWKKVDNDRIKRITQFYQDKIDELNYEIENLKNEKIRVEGELEKTNEQIRLYPGNTRIINKINELNEELEIISIGLRTNINSIEKSKNVLKTKTNKEEEIEIVNKYAGSSSNLNKKDLESNKKRVLEITENIEDQEEQRVAKKALLSAANKSHGITKEFDVIGHYCYEYNKQMEIPKNNITFTLLNEDGVQINLIGRIDGILKLPNGTFEFIEVKNRTKRLFKVIPDYEKVQILLYKWMYSQSMNSECTKCELVECYESKINCIECKDQGDLYLNEILNKFWDVIKYVKLLLQDDDYACEFLKMSKDERNAIILSQFSK